MDTGIQDSKGLKSYYFPACSYGTVYFDQRISSQTCAKTNFSASTGESKMGILILYTVGVEPINFYKLNSCLLDWATPYMLRMGCVVACRTGAIFLRFSGKRGQARGEREVRDTRDGRGAKIIIILVIFSRPSRRASLALRAPLALALSRLKNAKK